MIHPSVSAPSSTAYRRRLHYVDSSIQRSLLLAMVALEVALVAASTWLAHWYLNHLIEESLYRVHLVQTGPILMRLVEQGFPALGIFAVVNVIALALVAGIWSYHENLVLRDFTKVIEKTQQLDFSADPQPRGRHEVLALAAAWRARERTRFTAIRNQVALLDSDPSADELPQDMRIGLQRLNQLLP